MSKLCLRDVDMDRTKVGKFSASESSSCPGPGKSWNSDVLIATKRSMAFPSAEYAGWSVWKNAEFTWDPLSSVESRSGVIRTGICIRGGAVYAADPSCRSLKYSESFKDELRSRRSSPLLQSLSDRKFLWKQEVSAQMITGCRNTRGRD